MSKWESQTLGDITIKISDRDHFTPTYVEDGVAMISPKDINSDEKIDFSKCKYITREAHEHNCKKTDLGVGDLVFTRIGALLGKVCIVESWMPEFSILHSAAMIRTNDSIIDSEYLMYFIKSYFFQSQIKNEIQSIGVPDLGLDKIKRFKINFPKNTKEQRKIARILSTADAVIEKTRAAIAKYKAVKQGMLHDLFTRGIDPQTGTLRPKPEDAPELYKDSPLGKVPKDWDVEKIEDSEISILDGDRGINYPKENDFQNSGYCLFLSATNVTKNGFIFDSTQFISEEKDGLLGTGKLNREDIIVTTRGTVGNVVFYNEKIKYDNIRINSGMIILRNRGQRLSNDYLFSYVKNYMFELIYQRSLSGSAQPQLPIKDLKKFILLTPEKNEQITLYERIHAIDSKIEIEQNYLAKLQSIKAGLMADLLSGKKPVIVEENL